MRLSQITDGLSNTIMAGEKHVPIGTFGQGYLDSSTYNGDNPICYTRGAGEGVGIAQCLNSPYWQWGSSHTAVCQFVMVDGSVHGIFKTIDPDALRLLCVRDDGQPTPDY